MKDLLAEAQNIIAQGISDEEIDVLHEVLVEGPGHFRWEEVKHGRLTELECLENDEGLVSPTRLGVALSFLLSKSGN